MITIQQASANALKGYLEQKLTGSGVEVMSRWPEPDKELPPKTVTILLAGPRRDMDVTPHMLSKSNVGGTQVDSVWTVKACIQPMQLDVWARSDIARDDLLARLDVALHAGESSLAGLFNPDPVGPGVLLAVQDGWQEFGTTADFFFEEPDLDDYADAIGTQRYRATFRCTAYFNLALKVRTARMALLNFKLRMDETSTYDTYRP